MSGKSGAPDVHIHYRRPPDREKVFHQHLVHTEEGVLVTLATDVPLDDPVEVEGATVLDPGADALWFTFPQRWHDIGRFHDASGHFHGWYANILTPPTIEKGGVWRTTDLFLDLWLPADVGGRPSGDLVVLDRDQFDEAVERDWIDEPTREQALREVEAVVEAHSAGAWPPRIAREWTVERAREVLDGR